MTMTRLLRTTLVAVALAATLTGCSSSSSDNAAGTGSAAPGPTDTTVAPTTEGFCEVARDPEDPDDLLGTYESLLEAAPPEVAGDLQRLVDATRGLAELDADDATERRAELEVQNDEAAVAVATYIAQNCSPA